jgi:hypothetical protein
MLGKIWTASSGGKKELGKVEIVKMLAFIGQVQSGASPNPGDYLSAGEPSYSVAIAHVCCLPDVARVPCALPVPLSLLKEELTSRPTCSERRVHFEADLQ